MSAATITVIRGDGIGPSIVDSAIEILGAAGCEFDYDYVDAGLKAYEETGELLPEATLEKIAANMATLKGPLTTPIGGGFSSINVTLRKKFELYANVRPVISFEGTKSRFEDVNILTLRENMQGMYCGEGQVVAEDGSTAEAKSVMSREGIKRFIEFSYKLALKEERKKITLVHKANILKTTSGLFLEVGREVAKQYPQIETEEMIVDAACMNLVMYPERFDVIVTSNLFGDIVSDLCAGLVGGLGMAPGANVGDQAAIFEAVHGSAPDIAGKDIANPTSVILAAIQMLEYLGEHEKAAKILSALKEVIRLGEHTTRDLGGEAGTKEFTQAVIAKLA